MTWIFWQGVGHNFYSRIAYITDCEFDHVIKVSFRS